MLTSMNAYASMYHLYSFYLYPLQVEYCNFNMASDFEDFFGNSLYFDVCLYFWKSASCFTAKLCR